MSKLVLVRALLAQEVRLTNKLVYQVRVKVTLLLKLSKLNGKNVDSMPNYRCLHLNKVKENARILGFE